MALYDSFIDNMSAHPAFVQKLEKRRNARIVKVIDRYIQARGQKSALEVGVGIGLFKDAAMQRGYAYTALDRNQKMVDAVNNLHDGSVAVCASVPPVPKSLQGENFDVAYAAFVAEHLADGTELFHFTEALKSTLKQDGLLVLLCPDTRSMGIEFWNQDYTHRYPTTERNVSLIMKEAGFEIERIIHYKGAMWTNFSYWLTSFFGFFYRYRWMEKVLMFCGGGGKIKSLIYSVWQYIKIDTLFIIGRKK